MKKNILLLETVAKAAMDILENAGDVNVHEAFGIQSIDQIIAKNQIDAIITRGKGQVNAQLMDACPQLKIVARCGVGLDNIEVNEATKRGIKVVNAPNSNAATMAEHTISLMLMLQRNLFAAIQATKAGNWKWRNEYEGDEINGKTLGILGLGNIGKKVAKIAKAMGMNVIYWSAKKEEVNYSYAEFDVLLKESDIISIHLPLTKGTENLIDAKALSKMKNTALLINTARGKVIDQDALLEAIENNRIGGFAADVLSLEPPEPNDKLLSHPRSLITAHVGSLTATTYTQMCVMTVDNTLAILRGEKPSDNCIFNRKELQ